MEPGNSHTSDPHLMEDRCLVAPSPKVRKQVLQKFKDLKRLLGQSAGHSILRTLLRPVERRPPGFNDGLLRPHNTFRPGTSLAAARAARQRPRGVCNVAIVLVDFIDKKFEAEQDLAHYQRLWFGEGTNSVRDYFRDVSKNLVDVQGEIVGPCRMPHPLKYYANGQNGLGDNPPNARAMAKDAARIADRMITFTKYDNDGDGFVDAFVIVHAGQGAELTGLANDIWSHKFVLDGGPYRADNTSVYAYLTIAADSKLGVCAHELGHLVFGWPDLYDADSTSSGIGGWCLMASGSYNGDGDNPAPPSAWCKVDQGWVTVTEVTSTAMISLLDVKDGNQVLKLWKDGAPDTEYFLLENRQQIARDADLPGHGLCLWHIDETKDDNNDETLGYKVALVQADGVKDLENNDQEWGDSGDSFPGERNVRALDWSTNPSTNANNGAPTCVAITSISDSGPVMTFTVNVADYSAPYSTES
ncbi:uncharacterized protein [Physcomitrium patens]|uniref:Peptidase M6-like domain-containing protein n=1 Tax=Physcomitrium patens TaxID=3218 RepID=A9S6I4_PHYPA|nr:uncharacterized protein LOC112290318 [Physcomitrium patens]XP_024392240.1 uncharacterized protein LOC112290318 [Physcomitrium patens]XP_024392241.1 uncharacterized protein LOC112290318 [Physcomitrium patens]PNR42346.1 hypothetical protein PHYPA_017175 [Physcomitrium patens]|eukprot:XP_024392239.1 uncharacterized protein LOC112290318 [Physcomitrella patens]